MNDLAVLAWRSGVSETLEIKFSSTHSHILLVLLLILLPLVSLNPCSWQTDTPSYVRRWY
jgi:hypothetical protein